MPKKSTSSSDKNENNDKTLGDLIREGREKLGESQRSLARNLMIDNSGLAKIEKGIRKKPSVLILKKLALYLDLDLALLMRQAGYEENEIDVATHQELTYLVDEHMFLDDWVKLEKKNLKELKYVKKSYENFLKTLASKNDLNNEEINSMQQQMDQIDYLVTTMQKQISAYDEEINREVRHREPRANFRFKK